MRNIFKNISRVQKLIVLGISLMILFGGCMETTTPADKASRKLLVQLWQVSLPDVATKIPLKGDSVTIYYQSDTTKAIQRMVTDQLGQASFDLGQIPVIGINLYVTARHNDSLKIQRGVLLCVDTAMVFIFDTSGCSNACPKISGSFFTERDLSPVVLNDTLFQRSDKRTRVSVSSTARNFLVSTITLSNPDSACSAITVNAEVITTNLNDKQHKYAQKYKSFQIVPTQQTIQPGGKGIFVITFFAPTRQELDTLVKDNTAGNFTDSTLSERIKFTVEGRTCEQTIDLSAIMIVFPDLSPIINLRAFRQLTSQVPIPDNEVFYFGNIGKDILRYADGSAITNEDPTLGDIFLDVANNTAAATPPQDPELKIVATSQIRGMKLWQSNYAQIDFVNVVPVWTQFSSDPNRSTGYSMNPITGLKNGDIIAFDFGGSVYGLIYLRAVDNGTTNTSLQSAIEFRALFPIIAP